MSTYTDEQIENAIAWHNAPTCEDCKTTLTDMLRAWLAERKAARDGVTDEVVCRANVAQQEFFESTPFTGDSKKLTHESVRAALEAVAPMLRKEAASEPAKVPEAAKSAAKFLLEWFDQRPCDNSGVSCCIRCNAVSLSRFVLASAPGADGEAGG